MAIDLNNPKSREEALLTALISGQPVTINLNNPLSREEAILSAALLDQPYEGPINSRMEWLLNEWIKTGGGGDLQVKQVSPDIVQITVEPDEDYDGLSSVVVNAVTADIDSNIVSGNIKKDVTILGVTGSYEPNVDSKSIDTNGTYAASSDNLDGYSSVSVNVPNTYTAQDEGKVVSNGALVAQTDYPTTITANSIYDTTLYDSVTVNVQPPAPLQPTRSGATIYDYDGSVIATYTPEEFAALTEYPAHPTHEFLTADGYNWTLANAKAYSAKYGYVEVGAQYRVTDGKTRLFIRLEEGRLDPRLGLGINGSVDVDWGDGSAHDTMTGSNVNTTVYQAHTYAQAGDYIIALTVTGTMQFNGTSGYGYILGKSGGDRSTNRTYLKALRSLFIGDSVTSIGLDAFESCVSLVSIVIPDSVSAIGRGVFYSCSDLASVTIPNGIASIDFGTVAYCNDCSSVILSDSVTSIGNMAFQGDTNLSMVTMPDGVTTIDTFAFSGCFRLALINIPDGVTSIGSSAFQNCYGLGFIKFLGTTTIPTIANVSAWTNIPTDCYILVPFDYLDDYINTTNMPDDSTYLYLCYAEYADGATLPAVDGDGYALTWYATREDARAQTNPITVGNGEEIYARGVES